MTDISQLLQRQAEELSRLSQQISGTASAPGGPSGGDRNFGAEKPPVQTWPIPVKAGPANESQLPMLASDPSLSADSLPVLDAFRQFLEEERRRTRRRMIRLMTVGGLIVLGIMGVVAWGIDRSVRQTRRDLQVTQVKASQLATEQAEQVGKVSMTASNLERRMILERQRVQSVAVAATNLQKIVEAEKIRNDQIRGQTAETIGDQQAEIQRLKEMITSLEIDNALLTGSIKDLQGEGDSGEKATPDVTVSSDEIRLPDGAWITPLPAHPAAPLPASDSLPGSRVPVRLPNL
jgi:hypothetical protein